MHRGATFADLVRDHHAAVYRTARRIVRRDDDARDVTQQVFLTALGWDDRLRTADDPGRSLRWLARKTALMHLRSARSRKERERSSAMTETSYRPSDPARSEARGALRALVDGLPDDLRLAVTLRFHEGLSYEEVAELCECSRPTAHDRVRRAIERLRSSLSSAGFGLFAADVEGQLAVDDPPPVPRDLERSLLKLGGEGALVLPAFGTVVGALILTATSAALFGGGRMQRDPTPASNGPGLVTLSVDDRVESDPADDPRRRLAAAVPAPASLPTADVVGRIEGIALDRDGRPIAVDVVARSKERQGKFASHEATVRAGVDGRFAVDVPVTDASGTWYDLFLMLDGIRLDGVAEARVKNGVPTTGIELRCQSPLAEREGDYILDATLIDAKGRPLVSVPCSIHRVRPYAILSGREHESNGTTDANGRVQLTGRRLGPKRLEVRVGDSDGALRIVRLDISEAGRTEQEIVISDALTISGRVTTTDGERPRFQLVAFHDDDINRWFHADPDPHGAFTLHVAQLGSHTVDFQASGYARLTLRDIPAGEAALRIELKRYDDVTDRGSHRAEIHGHVRHIRTGAPIEVFQAALEIEAFSVPPDLSPQDYLVDYLPNHVYPPSRQIAIGSDVPDPSDAFHLVNLDPGRYAVRLQRPRLGIAFAGPFDLGPTDIARDVVIQVGEGGSIAGVVTDGEGRPLESARVFITGTGPISDRFIGEYDDEVRKAGGGGTFWFRHERTDERGRFELRHLPLGVPLRVCALHPDHAPQRTGELRLAEGRQVEGVTIRFATERER